VDPAGVGRAVRSAARRSRPARWSSFSVVIDPEESARSSIRDCEYETSRRPTCGGASPAFCAANVGRASDSGRPKLMSVNWAFFWSQPMSVLF
jgi:hypothetical protein